MLTLKEKSLSVEEVREIWNEWADQFPGALESSARPPDPALMVAIIPDVIKKLDLHPGETLLDAGCGSGYMLSEIVRQVSVEGCGADIAENQIRNAKKLFPKISFSAAPIEKLPFADASFDKVLCYSTLTYSLDWKKSVDEVLRVCKPGGRILLADLTLSHLRLNFYASVLSSVPAVLMDWKRLGRAVKWKKRDCPWHWIDMRKLKAYVESKGCSIQDLPQPVNRQYGCVTYKYRRDILLIRGAASS